MTTTTAAPGLSQIGQIAVNAYDTNRAIAFYRDTLGMTFLFQAGNLGFFDCGGVRLMLSPPESKEFDHPASVLYYKVADIQASHQTLVVARGDVHRRAARHPPHAAIRPVDGVFQGFGRQYAGADVRTAEGVDGRGSAGQNPAKSLLTTGAGRSRMTPVSTTR